MVTREKKMSKIRRIFILYSLFYILCSVFLLHAGAKRIVSLMPSYTEIIFELGAGTQLVGVTNFCNYPEEVKSIEKIGDYFNPNIEKIYSLKPDVVFVGRWKKSAAVSGLKNLGVKIMEIPEERKILDIFRTIQIIAKETDRKKQAVELINRMKKEISEIEKSKTGGKKSVYIEIDARFWTVGKNSFISDVIKKAGGKNIFDDIDISYFQTGWETVLEKNPQIIISLFAKKEEILKRPLADKLKAVSDDRIITDIDRDLFSRPTHRIVDIIKQLKTKFNEKN
jgi:iron complex transport system substrate-binding protein